MSGQGSGGNVIGRDMQFFYSRIGAIGTGVEYLAAIIIFCVGECQLFARRHWHFIFHGYLWFYFSCLGHHRRRPI